MKLLLPHALIVVAIAAWAGGTLSEAGYLVVFVGGHLLAPIWAAAMGPRGRGARAFLVGPGTIIAAHALLIAVLWLVLLGGFPEDTWISLMLLMIWTAVLAAYAVYCAIAFTLVAHARR